MDTLQSKYEKLNSLLRGYGSAAVAFSGGVDSTFLLQCAFDALGENALAVTVIMAAAPRRERGEAAAFCASRGIRCVTVTPPALPACFAENPPDRCYLCKKEIFGYVFDAARENGSAVVIDGTNADDTGDYRPGLRALAELGVRSPLKECGLTKADIRALSARLRLPTAAKPSAACLASRIPYGEPVTEEKLLRVDAAEEYLRAQGFTQLRVRAHGSLARIELPPEEIERLLQPALREQIAAYLKAIGFAYVTADLLGYRTGSLNEALTAAERETALSGGAE